MGLKYIYIVAQGFQCLKELTLSQEEVRCCWCQADKRCNPPLLPLGQYTPKQNNTQCNNKQEDLEKKSQEEIALVEIKLGIGV